MVIGRRNGKQPLSGESRSKPLCVGGRLVGVYQAGFQRGWGWLQCVCVCVGGGHPVVTATTESGTFRRPQCQYVQGECLPVRRGEESNVALMLPACRVWLSVK